MRAQLHSMGRSPACEKRYLEQALALHGWRMGETADALGISRKNLWEKMKKHGVAEPAR